MQTGGSRTAAEFFTARSVSGADACSTRSATGERVCPVRSCASRAPTRARPSNCEGAASVRRVCRVSCWCLSSPARIERSVWAKSRERDTHARSSHRRKLRRAALETQSQAFRKSVDSVSTQTFPRLEEGGRIESRCFRCRAMGSPPSRKIAFASRIRPTRPSDGDGVHGLVERGDVLGFHSELASSLHRGRPARSPFDLDTGVVVDDAVCQRAK